MKALLKMSLSFIGFIQALFTTLYCGLIAAIMFHGNKWFSDIPSILGPLLFLILFTTSALVCGILVFGYPIYIYFQYKKPIQALRLVIFTTLWLLFFISIIITSYLTMPLFLK